MNVGIVSERVTRGRSEQNGRHLPEADRTLITFLTGEAALPASATPRTQQQAFNRFIHGYNEERPRQAPDSPPATVYCPSDRSYPCLIQEPEFPVGTTVARERTSGEIEWKAKKVCLTQALIREPPALTQKTDRTQSIYVDPLEFGLLDERYMKTIKTPVKVLPMSPALQRSPELDEG